MEHAQPSYSWLDRALAYGPFVLLLFGPVAFGAVEPWSIFTLEAGAALLFVLWAVRQTMPDQPELLGNPLFLPILAFAALILLQWTAGLTAYRYATRSQAVLYCAYGLLCFVVVQGLRRTRQVRALAITLSVYGSALALFALVQSLISNGKLYWLRTPRFGGWIYGPYVNHNHYAGLMEMLVPIPLVFALTNYARGPRKRLAALAAAIMATTIFLSGSRGGMLAFTVEMCVLATILIKRRTTQRAAWALGVFMVIVVGLLIWLGGGELTQRLASIDTETRKELSGGMRVAIDRDGLRMFAHKPVLGWGLGTFVDVYPRFRSFYSDLVVDQAHNDYLQLLTETGAIGFLIVIWYVAVLYRKAAQRLGNWPRDTNGAVALAAMLGGTGILVHSFVDFNLQIPANAAIFYVLCVVAAMESRFGTYRRRHTVAHDAMELGAPEIGP